MFLLFQSQNEDLQSEFTRLREDFNKDKEDHKLHDAQQNQEYMQLKQEKDLEIASLKGMKPKEKQPNVRELIIMAWVVFVSPFLGFMKILIHFSFHQV